MIVKSINEDLFLGYVGEHGKKLVKLVETEIPDSVYTNSSFVQLVADGDVQVISFGKGVTSPVVQAEVDEFLGGLYKTDPAYDAAGVAGDGANAKSTSTDTSDSFAIAEDSVLKLLVDGLFTETLTVAKGTYTFAQMKAHLNAQTPEHVTFDSDAGPGFWAETNCLGENAEIEPQAVAAGELNANTVLKLPANATNTSTLVPEAITDTVKGPTNKVMRNAAVKLSVWDAASGGSLEADAIFQRISKGTYDAMYANEIEVTSDSNGEIALEMAHATAESVYVQVEEPTGYFLVSSPAARHTVVVA